MPTTNATATRTYSTALTLKKLIWWSEDDLNRALRLAHRYGGSVSEVLRAGIRALEREHMREVRRGEDDDEH